MRSWLLTASVALSSWAGGDADADAVCSTLAPSAVTQTEEASLGGSCEDWVEEIGGAYDDGAKAKVRAAKPGDIAIDGQGDDRAQGTSADLLAIEAEKSGSSWKLSKLSEGV